MSIADRARELRATIEGLADGYLEDTEALENTELFPAWQEDKAYEIGARVRYNEELYKCVQSHTSRFDWNPVDAVSLWAKVLIPDPEVVPDWVQPISTNPYMMGDKVRHNGKIWVSIMDYNVFEPGVAGWNEVN